jgi:DNA processing protein
MTKLTLTPVISTKLSRLKKQVKSLEYSGVNPEELLRGPCVAIVGTRRPTPYGKMITEELTRELVRAGITIISGLAFGIDSIAHQRAVNENGKTIAVLGSGLSNIYPASHANLAAQIKEHGCLISEYPEDHKPFKVEFLERNRIIAALSDIVIIPEAAEKSGSLNTARHAVTMKIPLCAFPGPTNSSMSSGTNELIKKGQANLITSALDVLKMLNIDSSLSDKSERYQNESDEQHIITAISRGITTDSGIQETLEIAATSLQLALTTLEIDGIISQDSVGNWYLR